LAGSTLSLAVLASHAGDDAMGPKYGLLEAGVIMPPPCYRLPESLLKHPDDRGAKAELTRTGCVSSPLPELRLNHRKLTDIL